ncbi:MAG: aldo/keto reductase, partial [Candidatus Competibacteraceae bacterium]|nr:aldo/keto reductase [Candidatus Competibacteraceae bacterium]
AREDVFLTTKVWMDKVGYDQTKRSTEESLGKLKTDYVDLLLIHWPSDEAPLEETLEAMAALRQEGRARFIGVSNFNVALLKKTVEELKADMLCNQVEYHPYLSQQPVLDYLRAHDMFLTAYSPIARGKTAKDDTLKAIGDQYGKSPVQVALRWLIQQDRVAAIPKASSREHCRANFEIFDFELSDEQMGRISALARPDGRLIDPSWAPRWDT